MCQARCQVLELGKTKIWFNGSDFWSEEPAAWPKKFIDCEEEVPLEVLERPETVNTISAVADCTPTECLLHHFTSLYRLKIATACFRTFQVSLKNKLCNVHLKTPRNLLKVVELHELELRSNNLCEVYSTAALHSVDLRFVR